MEAAFQLFEGRRADLGRAVAALRAPNLAGAVVIGEPGSGRTRFAREVAASWAATGDVIWVAASESSAQFSFGALSAIIPDLDPEDYGRSAARVTRRLAEGHDSLLVVDDAQLLDTASLAVVHRLAVSPGPLALLVTVDEREVEAPGLARMLRDGLWDHIVLEPLEAGTVIALLERHLQAPVERASAAKLRELSGGNPSLLLELVGAGTGSGSLAPRGGVWTWRGAVPASARLQGLVERRLGRLAPEARHAFEVVAIGEPVGLRELTRIVDLDGVVAAEAAGIIKIEQEQRRAVARCVHSMHAQLFRAQLGTARMLKTLREIDGVLADTPSRRQSDTVKRALIRLEMGDAQPGDASILAEASKQARPDYVLAERLARAALDQGGGFTALDHLIDALFWQGRVEEATEAAAAVGEFASVEELEYFKARWSRMLWWISGERPGDALSAPDGEVGPGNDPLSRTRDGDPANGDPADAGKLGALARQAAMEAAGGRAPGALPMAVSLLAEPLLEDEGRCWAAGAAIIGLGGQGKVSEALALMDGARVSARRLQDYNYRLLLAVIEVRLRRLAGDLAGARDAVGDLRGVLAGARDANAGIVALIEAEIILATGSALDAVVHVRDAAASLDQLDFGGLSATAHLRLAESLALTGDTIGAADQLVLATATEDRVLELFRPEQLLSKAWTHFAVGSTRLGLDALSEARSIAQTQGEGLVELHVHHSGLRLGDRGAAREVLKLARGIEGPFAAAAGQHAKAWLDSDADGLVAAAEQFAAMGALGHAADAIAQAARRAQQSGESATSLQLAVRAADIAADLGGLNTPALRRASPRASLTRRQRDVTRLAAEGLSSREIAERLGVGVRTIESHLDAAYRRLGVSSRAELTALLRPV